MQTQPKNTAAGADFVNQRLVAEHHRYKDAATRLEDELAQTRALLGQLGQQLRTPLTAIIGYGDMLYAAAQDTTTREQLAALLAAADSAASVLRDIPVSSAVSGAHPYPCNPATLAKELRGFFAYDAAHKPLDFTVDWGSSIPEGLYCDLPRLRHILLLLVQHAFKTTERGHICVSAKLHRISDHEAQVQFAVEDSGIGYTTERQKQLFSPAPQRGFGRAESVLPAAAAAIQVMGGQLLVESAYGEGSRFSFLLALPIHYGAEIMQEERNTPLPLRPDSWQKARVLVVDDNAMNCALLARMAENLGIGQVDTAENGEDAAEQTLAYAYDLILMDCQMPRMDGFTAARLLRHRPHTADVPIIGITADVLQSDTAKCYAAGMDDYYHKPLSLAQLERILHKWLD